MTAILEVEAYAGDVDDVHARTREVCGRINRGHAELVEIMAGLLESGLWAEGGIRSPEHWLTVRGGLAPGRARDIVTMARRWDELPETVASLMAGRLSIDQASVVAQHVPATHSRAATALAEKATVNQLRRVLPRFGFPEDKSAPGDKSGSGDTAESGGSAQPGGGSESGDTTEPQDKTASGDWAEPGDRTEPRPDPIAEKPQLQMYTRDGRFHLRYDGPESDGALIEKATREAKESLFQAGQTDATLADGLLEVANRSLSCVESTSRMNKYRIYVHLDTAGGWMDRGGRLPKHMLDRLTCDGVLQPVWETEGHPVNVGRAQRIVPRRTRRLIEARDKGCRFPGCGTSGGHVEVHHIRHWRDDGLTNTSELVCLCSYHHDAHHRGEFGIKGNANELDGLAFTGRGGWPLHPLTPQHPMTPQPPRHLRIVDDVRSGPEPPPPDFHGPLGERLHPKWLDLPANDHQCWAVWPRSLGGDRDDDDHGYYFAGDRHDDEDDGD